MTLFSLKTISSTFLITLFCLNAFAQAGTNNDSRMKIRLGFTSATNSHKQILVTVDENTTAGIDFGYDGEMFDSHPDDMYWMIDNRKFTIQGIDVIDESSSLPIGINTSVAGMNTILIDELLNVPNELQIVLLDKQNNTYHNIKNNSGFTFNVDAGTYLDRFELRFVDNSDDTNNNDTEEEEEEEEEVEEGNDTTETEVEVEIDTELEVETEVEVEVEAIVKNKKIEIQFINNTKSIILNNPANSQIVSVQVYSFTGQLKANFNNTKNDTKVVIQTNNLNSGKYIIRVNTNLETTSKKIVVN